MKALIDAWTSSIECRVCKIRKHFDAYHPNKVCRFNRVRTCRDCTANKNRQWYKDNRKKRQEAANRRNQDKKLKAIKYLGGKCDDCFGIFPPCVYDFHHVDDTKEKNPSSALAGSFEKAKEELDKCVLLCANCHRLRHFGKEV